MTDIKEKVKLIVNNLNSKGFPLPLLRDPKSGNGSISFTMLFISFNMVLVGLIGKWGKQLDLDLSQAINWFLICASLYFGRQLSSSNKNTQVSSENNNPNQ